MLRLTRRGEVAELGELTADVVIWLRRLDALVAAGAVPRSTAIDSTHVKA